MRLIGCVAATVFMVWSTSASSFTLTNSDEAIVSLVVIEGQGDATVDTIDLLPGESIFDICFAGCRLRLLSGAEQEFSGEETILVRDGGFDVAKSRQ